MKNFLIGVLLVAVIVLGYLQFKPQTTTNLSTPKTSEIASHTYKSSIQTSLPKYIGGQSWPPTITHLTSTYSCTETEATETTKVTETTVNNNKYCTYLKSEGAMGTIFYDYTVTTPSRNGAGTESITFTLAYTSCGHYKGNTDGSYEACTKNQSDVTEDLSYYIDSLLAK